MNVTSTTKSALSAATSRSDKHIVEVLIEERAQKLIKSRFWPLYRAFLYPLLKYGKAVSMVNEAHGRESEDVLSHVSTLLNLDVHIKGIQNIPATGRVLIAPTHPTGIADGIAMFDALKSVRPDQIYFANRDAIRMAPQLIDHLIPVEWVPEKRTRERSRETLIATKNAFTKERCVVLFPSGRIAYMNDDKVLTEQEWMPSIVILAKKYNCPIVPVHMKARNSWLYYWFWKINTELRDITLFNELLNKKGERFEITIGKAISADTLEGDATEVATRLRNHAAHAILDNKNWDERNLTP